MMLELIQLDEFKEPVILFLPTTMKSADCAFWASMNTMRINRTNVCFSFCYH